MPLWSVRVVVIGVAGASNSYMASAWQSADAIVFCQQGRSDEGCSARNYAYGDCGATMTGDENLNPLPFPTCFIVGCISNRDFVLANDVCTGKIVFGYIQKVDTRHYEIRPNK